jgi:hypothetical protein
MKWFKLLLWAIIIIFGVLAGFWIISFLYSALWYLFWIGVLTFGGFIGYKLLKKNDNLELEGRDTVSQIELENAKLVKSLEEYKRETLK